MVPAVSERSTPLDSAALGFEVYDAAQQKHVAAAGVRASVFPPPADSVIVSGITGAHEAYCGVYRPSLSLNADGYLVYEKEGGGSGADQRLIEMLNVSKRWVFKQAADAGKSSGWIMSEVLAAPSMRSVVQDAARWEVWDADQARHVPVPAVCVRVCPPRAESVQVCGIVGANEGYNGCYHPAPEVNVDGLTYYRKAGGDARLLELLASGKRWVMKPEADRGKGVGWLQSGAVKSISYRSVVQSAAQWQQYDAAKKEFVDAPAVTVRVCPPEANSVLLSGIVGAHAGFNGVYRPMALPNSDNFTIYESANGALLEILEVSKRWTVKNAGDRGKSVGWIQSAMVVAPTHRSVVETAGAWELYDDKLKAYVLAPGISVRVCPPAADSVVVKGLQASLAEYNGIFRPLGEPNSDGYIVYQQQGGSRLIELLNVSRRWTFKPASDRGRSVGWVLSELIAAPTMRTVVQDATRWEVYDAAHKEHRVAPDVTVTVCPPAADSVRVTGIVGPHACYNGTYRPLPDANADGFVVYQQQGDTPRLLELLRGSQKWTLKPAADRGRAVGYLQSEAVSGMSHRSLAEAVTAWELYDNEKKCFCAAPAVKVVPCPPAADAVAIRGITGAQACFNGLYRALPEPNADNITIYQQVGDTRLIEMLSASKRWTMKNAGDRGKSVGWVQSAVVAAPTFRSLLETATGWEVYNSERKEYVLDAGVSAAAQR